MFEEHSYVAVPGKARIKTRDVIRVSRTGSERKVAKANRTFVPFSGFDGQALAGKGELVFEGELLEVRN